MEPFRWLLRPDFYTAPVLLETCEPGELLGCRVSVEDETVSYGVPSELWQYRCPESGGSIRVNLSGFCARLFIIARQVYPVQNRSRQIRKLIVKYREIGFSYEDLVKCMPRKFRKLHQEVIADCCTFLNPSGLRVCATLCRRAMQGLAVSMSDCAARAV